MRFLTNCSKSASCMNSTQEPPNSTTPAPDPDINPLGLIGLGVFLFVCCVFMVVFCREGAKCVKHCCEFLSTCTKAMRRCCSRGARRLRTRCRNCSCHWLCMNNSVNVQTSSNQTRSSELSNDIHSLDDASTAPARVDWVAALPAYVDVAAPPPTYSFAMRDVSMYTAPPPDSPSDQPPPDYEEAMRHEQYPEVSLS